MGDIKREKNIDICGLQSQEINKQWDIFRETIDKKMVDTNISSENRNKYCEINLNMYTFRNQYCSNLVVLLKPIVTTIVFNLEHIEHEKAKQQFKKFMKELCTIDINSKINPMLDVSKILYETKEPILIRLVQEYESKIDVINQLFEEIKEHHTNELYMIKLSQLLIEFKSKIDTLYTDIGL